MMEIVGEGPSSLLLNHLLIPVGAELKTQVDLLGPLIEDHLPRSLDNLRNLSGFTKIHLHAAQWYPQVQFSGPNGKVTMIPVTQTDTIRVVLESLARFDTSKVEQLEIDCDDTLSRDLPYQTLLPMEGLRTLTLFHCQNSRGFIAALRPNTSSSEAVVCPKLEELVLAFPIDRETFDMKDVIGMAAGRASRETKLKSVGIDSRDDVLEIDSLELEKHVLRVEYGPDVDWSDDGSDEES